MAKVKAKGKGAKGGPKDKKDKKHDKAGGGGDQPGKAFPLEKGPTPSKLDPVDITWLYKLPDNKFKTEEDVIHHHGYKLEEKLDAGGFGVIFFARDKKNVRVACKLMELGTDWKDSRIDDMKNELFIMEKVKHLYIVKLHCHFMTQASHGNRLYIMMELADGGNFAKFVQKKGSLTEAEAKPYFAQIVCGINHMHSLGIAHRDIKLQNVLLQKNEKSISGDFTLLVADFGLSRIIHHSAGGGIEKNRTVCGTPLFMAPEILNEKPYEAFLVDQWALGVTIFIMMSLELPFDFKDEKKAVEDMMNKKWDWPKGKMKAAPSADLKSMTSSLLEPDPSKRLAMSPLCSHKWLAAEFKKAQAMANKMK